MTELDTQLAGAAEHVAEAEARVARQRKIIEAMERHGLDTRIARSLISILERGLADLREIHQTIAGMIARENSRAAQAAPEPIVLTEAGEQPGASPLPS